MKHQQVSVDYWAMGRSMLIYGALTALVWLMLRLVSAVFTLPRRLRAQHDNMEATLKELQRRYPDLNITEEDLKNAEKDFEELMKENNSDKEITETSETTNKSDDKEPSDSDKLLKDDDKKS